MNFSKITLFAAAALIGSASLAHATDLNLDNLGNFSGNISVAEGGSLGITLSGANTINGTFLTESGSLSEQDVVVNEGGGSFGSGDDDGKITVSGGGVLSYIGGLGSGYYTQTYSSTRQEAGTDMNQEARTDMKDVWNSVDSFWNSGAFTGTVEVGKDTTLSLAGQLTQYVHFYAPNAIKEEDPVSSAFSGYAGVSKVVLKENATLSFANSNLNMYDARPNLGSSLPGSGYTPNGVNALNFINNLESEKSSVIELGTDEASVNRIVLHSDGGEISTVGQLSGNGRLYTLGTGAVAFIGASALNSGTRVDENGRADVSGNTWLKGNRLADIVLGNALVYVGAKGVDVENGNDVADSKANADAVNDVFRNATAVQISSLGNNSFNGSDSPTYAAVQGDSQCSYAIRADGTKSVVTMQAEYVADPRNVAVTVYGKQVFNNFQSLWMERSNLLDEPYGTIRSLVSEPVRFSNRTGQNHVSVEYSRGRYDSTGTKNSVRVAGGAVLTINQDVGRDGWFGGLLYTDAGLIEDEIADAGEGLVVKTGKGRFYYAGPSGDDGALTRLRIEEGEWIGAVDGMTDTHVTLAKEGILTLRVETTSTNSTFFLQGTSENAKLSLVRDLFLENDLTADSLAAVAQAGGNTEGVSLKYREYHAYHSLTAANVQFTKQQTQFLGEVVVNDGITLTLGERDNAKSKSIFSSAAKIVLNGDGAEKEETRYSTLAINGLQVVRNIEGSADKSLVNISHVGTLVLLNNNDTVFYTGGFVGDGNLIKFGTNSQTVVGDGTGDLRGVVGAFAGGIVATQSRPDVGYEGLVLNNSSQVTFNGPSKIGTLVGTRGTGVSFSSDLTIGGATVSPDFLKNPAELLYLNGSAPDDRNGAFMKLYATTDAKVFEQMQNASDIFKYGDAKNARDWLKAVFTEAEVETFIKKGDAQLSASMAEDLVALAHDIASGAVDNYLDSDGNLNTPGWNKLVAASGLEFLEWKFITTSSNDEDAKLLKALLHSQEYDSSLYGFITAFVGVDKYKFILTEGNAQLISKDFGVSTTGWFNSEGGIRIPDYKKFAESFGLSEADAKSGVFAGTLSGSGNLQKVGSDTDTLTLTGASTYSGKTIVNGGRLAVNWDSIQATSAVTISSGATLEVSAKKTDSYDGNDSGTLGDTYGRVFSGETVRLSGTGTLEKIGDGNIDLGKALWDVAEDGSDFTGDIEISEGAVRVAVDTLAREKNPLAFDVEIDEAAKFELVFSNTEDGVNLGLDGNVSGAGTFVVDTGSVLDREGNLVAGKSNSLTVEADRFSAGTVELKSGTLNIIANQQDYLNIGKIKLDGNASPTVALTLKNDVASNVSFSGSGALVVSTLANDEGVFNKQTLTINGSMSGVSSLTLAGGAHLVLADFTSPDPETPDEIELTKLSAESADTALTIGENRVVSLDIKEGEVSTLAGTLYGSGKFIFNGAASKTEGVADGKLVIGSEDAESPSSVFSGTIEFNSGTISLVAGEGKTLSYSGLSIVGTESVADKRDPRTLEKAGAGTVEILFDKDKGNELDLRKLNLVVTAGELAVSGAVCRWTGTSEDEDKASLTIAEHATFRLKDPFEDSKLDLSALGTLSGQGKLAFETDPEKNLTVSVTNFTPDPDPFSGVMFSGVIEIGKGVEVVLGEDVKDFSAFSGDGTVKVHEETTDLTVTVNSNADGVDSFKGEIVGDALKSITVVGDGALAFAEGDVPVDTIYVGNGSQNGGIGVDAKWTGTLEIQGASSRVLISGLDNGSFRGKTEIAPNVSKLVLLTDGTITLGNDALKKTFALSGGNGVAKTLGNIAGTQLILKNLNALGKTNEDFELQTAQGGAIVFDGEVTTKGVGTLATTAPVSSGTWSKDISGTGGIVLQNGADLTLTSSALSYTGTTVVGAGTTLTYAAENGVPTVSESSELYVKTVKTGGTVVGGTVVGGVDLVGENSSVTFDSGSTFVFTGNAIRFTGTATAKGRINVTLSDEALLSRGSPVSLFEYIGAEGTAVGKNNITLDNIDFVQSDHVFYYKDVDSAPLTTGKTVIYIATDDLASVPGVKLHKGQDLSFVKYLSEIATPENGMLRADLYTRNAMGERIGYTTAGSLANTIIKTPNSSLSGVLNNLSPLSYGAMLALPQSGFVSDMAAVAARVEQRRYDNYTSFIWETNLDWEYFAQAQGSLAEADEGEPDTRTFDMNSYGAIAGMDVKLNAETVAGFAFSYDYGEADIHNNGGDIKGHDIRATAFFGKLIESRFYIDSGAQVGFAMYDVNRNTAIGGVDGDTTGWHAGAFANFGMLMNLLASEDEKTTLNLMPYFGFAYSYYGVSAFKEKGVATALDTDSFGASSLRASLGASLVLTTPCFGHSSRLNLDFAYTRELLDSEADIDYAMPGLTGSDKYTAKANAFAEDTFSIGPRFSFDLDRDSSIYCGYRFDMSTDSDVAHSVNLGFRSRF